MIRQNNCYSCVISFSFSLLNLFQGDGAPGFGPNSEKMVESKPFSIKLEVDIVQILLFIGALVTRTWQIGLPHAVV